MVLQSLFRPFQRRVPFLSSPVPAPAPNPLRELLLHPLARRACSFPLPALTQGLQTSCCRREHQHRSRCRRRRRGLVTPGGGIGGRGCKGLADGKNSPAAVADGSVPPPAHDSDIPRVRAPWVVRPARPAPRRNIRRCRPHLLLHSSC